MGGPVLPSHRVAGRVHARRRDDGNGCPSSSARPPRMGRAANPRAPCIPARPTPGPARMERCGDIGARPQPREETAIMSATRERPRRKLPTGIQNLREIREDDCYYVDKTAYVPAAGGRGRPLLSSRDPRRFGKSLFLDTLKELFEGNEALFVGLAVHDRLGLVGAPSRGAARLRQRPLQASRADLHSEPDGAARRHRRRGRIGKPITDTAPGAPAASPACAISCTVARTGQRAAVLVDEYDKPILDALEVPEVACANRDLPARDCTRSSSPPMPTSSFAFLTGVSKFSKVEPLLRASTTSSRPHPGARATRRSAAIPRRTWMRCSRPSCSGLDRDTDP